MLLCVGLATAGLGAVAAASAGSGQGALRGQVRVTVRGAAKADASGVVIYLTGFTEPAPASVPELEQRDKAFHPAIVPVTVGQSVAFPNRDAVFHNVFSLSPSKAFDLGQYKTGESKSRTFSAPGIVDVYCNIHPQMAATVLVLPNRRHATSGKDGSFAIDGVPPGRWTLFAYSRFADKPVKREVAVSAGETVSLEVTIDELRTETPHLNKYGQPYAKDGGYK